MAFWTVGLFSNAFILVLTSVVGVLMYFKYKFSYWSWRNVPVCQPTIPFGNAGPSIMHRESQCETLSRMYFDFKHSGHRFGGLYYFTKPVFVPVDLELVKDMLTVSFNHFHDRGFHFDEENDPLSANLVVLPGERWKNLRAKLSPAFSSGKMKSMFHILVSTGEQLKLAAEKTINSNEPLNIQDLLERFTADVIASCGFGMETNCINDPNAEFLNYAREVLQPGLLEWIKHVASHSASELLKLFQIRVSNDNVLSFFQKIVNDTIEYRQKNNVQRKDYMDLLIQLRNKGRILDDDNPTTDNQIDEKLTQNEIVAQAFMFFIAGYETSSATMSFVLFELATNPSIQGKVRAEVATILQKYNGKLTYESLSEMTYLEKVINESLRLHPPIPVLVRQCTKAYKIPGTNILLEKGTDVHIPIYGIQKDPDFFSDPDKFDPERFSEDNKLKRISTAFLAFGEGPRRCIGTRFGYMQTKIGLISLLKDYTFSLSDKTELPMIINPKTLHHHFLQTIWLDAIKD